MTTPTPRADVLREAADRALFVIEHYAEYDRRSVSHVDCGGEPGIHDPLVIEAARLRTALATPAHPEPLDVERLARAMASVDIESDPTDADFALAGRYAAEYARLSETPQ